MKMQVQKVQLVRLELTASSERWVQLDHWVRKDHRVLLVPRVQATLRRSAVLLVQLEGLEYRVQWARQVTKVFRETLEILGPSVVLVGKVTSAWLEPPERRALLDLMAMLVLRALVVGLGHWVNREREETREQLDSQVGISMHFWMLYTGCLELTTENCSQ